MLFPFILLEAGSKVSVSVNASLGKDAGKSERKLSMGSVWNPLVDN